MTRSVVSKERMDELVVQMKSDQDISSYVADMNAERERCYSILYNAISGIKGSAPTSTEFHSMIVEINNFAKDNIQIGSDPVIEATRYFHTLYGEEPLGFW